jgi:hypothetical protein
MAVKNGNMSMTTTMEDIEATMLYIASEDKTYMMFPSIKMYTEVTEDMMGGDMDMSELTGNFKISAPDNITVTDKTFNGKQVKCESFVLDGVQSNYYFDASGNLLMAPRRSIVYKNFYLDKEHEKPVYCLDYIINNNITTAMICEGPIDVLTCYTYGYPAIGTFGNPSPFQIEAINKSPIKVLYLAMDNDAAGRRMANTIRAGLDPRIIIKEVVWPNGRKDPGECTFEEFNFAMINAKNS